MFRYTFGIELNSIKDSLHKVKICWTFLITSVFPSNAVTILQRCRVKHHQRRV